MKSRRKKNPNKHPQKTHFQGHLFVIFFIIPVSQIKAAEVKWTLWVFFSVLCKTQNLIQTAPLTIYHSHLYSRTHTHKLTGADLVCRLHRGSDSPAEIPPASEPGRRTTRWTKTHKGGKKSSLNRNQRKLSCSSVQRACHCRGEAHPPEEAAQRHLPVSRRPQFLQQEIDALHADLLLQQLWAQLGEPVTCSLPTAQAHTHARHTVRILSLQYY